MKYVIDASAVIDFLEARASVASWLPTVVPRDVGLPAAVLARLVERAHGEPERRRLDLLAVLSEMLVVPLGRAEAEKAGELLVWAEQRARVMDFADACCAATAIVRAATLVTVRSGVFVDVPDLRVDVR